MKNSKMAPFEERFMLRPTAIFTALLLSACASVGPDYKKPLIAPVTLNQVQTSEVANGDFDARWWTQFGDATLNQLIAKSAGGNLDLQIATARIKAARAVIGETQSNQLPTVDVGASYSRTYEVQPSFTRHRVGVNQYRGGFDASWELDVFGGTRRAVESARASAEAAVDDLHAAQVSVLGEVARNYFDLRGAQRRLQIARDNLATQQETLKLTTVRRELGRGIDQDVASAAARVATTEAEIPSLEGAARIASYRLAVLLGQRPGEIDVDLAPLPETAPPVAAVLNIGNATDFLEHRPDVQAAERRLAAATADIGVAVSDYYPHVQVGGFIGFFSGASADLGSLQSQAFSIAPSITWTGLNVQRVHSRVVGRKAAAEAQLADYQQTVLLALEDTEAALAHFDEQRKRLGYLREQAQQSRKAADYATVRYKEGATDFLTLLDAQRTALAADDLLAQGEAAINTSAIAVYKALGGGWQACGDLACTALAQAAAPAATN